MGQGGPMSAVNSNSDDRDLEAIRRAQRAHEPSMEEILASIRNIIADEREPAPSCGAETGAAGRRRAAPQIVYSKDGARPPHRSRSEPAHRGGRRTRRRSYGAGRSRPIPIPQPNRPRRDEEPLLSSEANEAVTASFGACRPISRRAAPSSLTAWCARCCVRCSSSGWTRTCRPSSSDWCARKSSASRAGAK